MSDGLSGCTSATAEVAVTEEGAQTTTDSETIVSRMDGQNAVSSSNGEPCDLAGNHQSNILWNEVRQLWYSIDKESGGICYWSEHNQSWTWDCNTDGQLDQVELKGCDDEVQGRSIAESVLTTNNSNPIESPAAGPIHDPSGIGDTSPSSAANTQNMHWDGDQWVFVQPETREAMIFDQEKQQWVTKEENSEEDESELESDEDKKNDADDFDYQLRMESKERRRFKEQAKKGKQRIDPDDGTVYDWDPEKKAWIPMVDDDFLAQYQANYGFYESSTATESSKLEDKPGQSQVSSSDTNVILSVSFVSAMDTAGSEIASSSLVTPIGIPPHDGTQPGPSVPVPLPPLPDDPREAKKERRRRAREAEKNRGWFEVDEAHNTNVYVSNLPLDVTMDEFEEMMSKYGIIDRDANTRQLKLKLYKDEDGTFKGDGRCCYIKVESVELALKLLDGYELRGCKIVAQRAQFQQKGTFDPKRRKRVSAKQKLAIKAKKEKLFDWRPEKLRGERPRSDCTVVIKNVFTPGELLDNAALLFDLQELLKTECQRFGIIKKIMVYDNNPDGIATVTFDEPEMADDCLTMMNYRYLRNRQLRAERWDGKAKYKVGESEEEQKKRIEQWNKFLESSDEPASAGKTDMVGPGSEAPAITEACASVATPVVDEASGTETLVDSKASVDAGSSLVAAAPVVHSTTVDAISTVSGVEGSIIETSVDDGISGTCAAEASGEKQA